MKTVLAEVRLRMDFLDCNAYGLSPSCVHFVSPQSPPRCIPAPLRSLLQTFFNKSMSITPEIHYLRNLSTIFNYKIVLLKTSGFLAALLMRNAARLLPPPHSQSILNPKHNIYSIMAPDLCLALQTGSYAVACSCSYLCIQRTIPRTPPFLKAICT